LQRSGGSRSPVARDVDVPTGIDSYDSWTVKSRRSCGPVVPDRNALSSEGHDVELVPSCQTDEKR
jgi:hypothetical protein